MLTPCLRRPVNGAEMGHKKKPHHHWRIQLLNLVAVVVLSTPHTILVHSLHNTIPSGDILRGFENIPTLPQCLAHNRYQLCTPRLVSFINLKWSVLLNTNYTYIHLLVALFDIGRRLIVTRSETPLCSWRRHSILTSGI